jgi:hypothetical protein
MIIANSASERKRKWAWPGLRYCVRVYLDGLREIGEQLNMNTDL